MPCWIAFDVRDAQASNGQLTQPPAWLALRFTSRVALHEEAVLMEISDSLRLWGGQASLVRQLRACLESAGFSVQHVVQGETSLQALAMLRIALAGNALPQLIPRDLPLHTLSALRPHVAPLAHMGCNTWGDLQALPRGGVARRFGASVLQALDRALGKTPHGLHWLALPEVFDMAVELPALADAGPALLHAASRLLQAMQSWLQARQQGVLAFEFSWKHDLRRFDGVDLPREASLSIRTAKPTQDMAHLRRLLGERLERTTLAAPANQIRVRIHQSASLPHVNANLAFDSAAPSAGMAWHELVERLGARLGAHNVQMLELQDDHRPEAMQRWHPASEERVANAPAALNSSPHAMDARLLPAWLVRPAKALSLRGGKPWHHGALRLLCGPQRLEAGWWEESDGAGDSAALAVRDYFVAHNDAVGLVWIYRERLPRGKNDGAERCRWFLQGIYG